MKRKFGLNRVGKGEQQKAIHKLDISFSKMIRERDKDKRCISCPEVHEVIDAGHFRRRECMSTRFDYKNVNGQGLKENRFEGGRTFEQSIEIDNRWGKGTAKALEKKSRLIKQWSVNDLNALRDATKSYVIYCALYDSLNP